MQLIKNGPDVPNRLLHEHAEGRVVFFCGSGISLPAGLPDFHGLAHKLFDRVGEAPKPVERKALKSGLYDTAIGLLERRVAGGPRKVREVLPDILTPTLTSAADLATHRALLDLSADQYDQVRLVTTNFDHLFRHAQPQTRYEFQAYQAPLLPVPKGHFRGIVYLHGLLPQNNDAESLEQLVLSSGDFGRAYLIERWAARFVSELFRRYTVCFVGYTINDPVLRYMMDALAADQLAGESTPEMFAFGQYSRSDYTRQHDLWRAKNVTPILYKAHRRHAYLHRTLRSWAQMFRDGVQGNERLIVEHAPSLPTGTTDEDDFVGRVAWALSDPSGLPAKCFAELHPAPPVEWLDVLREARFGKDDLHRFGLVESQFHDADSVQFSLLDRPAAPDTSESRCLVRAHIRSRKADPVLVQLSRWIRRHLEEQRVILWVAQSGGILDEPLRGEVEEALRNEEVGDPAYRIWEAFLAGRVGGPSATFDFFSWRRRLDVRGLTTSMTVELRDLLTPRFILERPFVIPELESDGNSEENDSEGARINRLVRWEITLGIDHLHHHLGDLRAISAWNDALPSLLPDMTGLLQQAMDLMAQFGGAADWSDMSYVVHPSIEEHHQNTDFRDWSALIVLSRDAWLAMHKIDPARARNERDRWRLSRYPVFRRLFIYTLIAGDDCSGDEGVQCLLEDGAWWLWSVEVQREALQLLGYLAPRLSQAGLTRLEAAVINGPPRAMFRDDADDETLVRIVDRETWLRLAKLQSHGASLSHEAKSRLATLLATYPAWGEQPSEQDEFPVWMGTDTDPEWRSYLSPPEERHALVDWLQDNPTQEPFRQDGWRELTRRMPRTCAAALIYLARQGDWIPDRWREALHSWTDDRFLRPTWIWLNHRLVGFSDSALDPLSDAAAAWLRHQAPNVDPATSRVVDIALRVVEMRASDEVDLDDDVVLQAINSTIGRATEAVVLHWLAGDLRDEQGLRADIAQFFSKLCVPDVSAFAHGRVLLGAHVIALYRVDSVWTENNLLRFFNWRDPNIDAACVWKGFLWTPRAYAPLLAALHEPFLECARNFPALGEHGRQYAGLLAVVSVDGVGDFSDKELAWATQTLPTDGLLSVVSTIRRILESAEGKKARYWHDRVKPYFERIWPKDKALIDKSTANGLADVCISAGPAFPDAVEVLTPWLRYASGPDLVAYRLNESTLPDDVPDSVLEFLDVVVPSGTNPVPHKLGSVLARIADSGDTYTELPAYRRLRDACRRAGSPIQKQT